MTDLSTARAAAGLVPGPRPNPGADAILRTICVQHGVDKLTALEWILSVDWQREQAEAA